MASKKVCHGCLSVGRKLAIIEDHAKLYNRLLLKKSEHSTKQLMMCWECHQTLKNIQMFRMKITQAQRLLSNKSLPQNSLSNLATSKKIDNYQVIIYEDEKNVTTDIEVPLKQEPDLYTEIEIKNVYDNYDIKLVAVKEEVKNESDGLEGIEDNQEIELDEVLDPILPKNSEVKEERPRKRAELKQKYRTIIFDDIQDKRNYYDVVKIGQEAALSWLEKRKERASGKQFQCQLCYAGFKQKKFYDRHLTLLHAQSLKFECDLCACRFKDRSLLKRHIDQHFVQFSCKLCGLTFPSRSRLYVHFAHGPHGRQMECKKCGARFDCTKPRDFYTHYRETHGLPQCDHCGLRTATKTKLARHILVRHTDFRCKPCDMGFSSFHALTTHNRRKHVVDTSERNYCVECDLQFTNSVLYNEHVTRSTKHSTKPRVACPMCDKTYSKRCYMTNHYNLEHLKESKYICPRCDRRFLNGFRLRYHVKYYHEKAPKPKNHICTYCGRGFNTRRILDNHVRTHTGERPFACPHCTAAFAQLTALKTHVRSAHK
ncbi:gastrula zinc finger protein XlCGF26.1-like [Leguminivora glycinivorella]|uniref:gastrula zinc finger protein XlCGF26.1-like n=1 Tax=Leguminivora glycinivorella TaxID=1035111 RepID=UPI00200E341C|nr:gastrula zinc finger protein XlCGF26.1-like [Leguminivora glycinivorella]